jgi:hypothetical protein
LEPPGFPLKTENLTEKQILLALLPAKRGAYDLKGPEKRDRHKIFGAPEIEDVPAVESKRPQKTIFQVV